MPGIPWLVEYLNGYPAWCRVSFRIHNPRREDGLLDEMNELLDQVTTAEHNLESAFYECESVFEEAISELELRYEE